MVVVRSETNFYHLINHKVDDPDKIREIDKISEDKRNARYARRLILEQIREAQEKIKVKKAQ